MKTIRKVLAILLALALCVSSLFTFSVAASATATDVQAVIDNIAVDNDTTQESIEAAVKAVYSDAVFNWTTDFFKKEAMPEVDVKLKNGDTYDVYYTQAGTPGRVTGTATITVAGVGYDVILNKVITSEKHAIECNSMETINYANGTSETYTGNAELLVIKNASSDNGVIPAGTFIDVNSRPYIKAVIIDSLAGFRAPDASFSRAFANCKNLQGVFIDKAFVNLNFWGYAFYNCNALRYFYINSIQNPSDKTISFKYGVFEGCWALEYLSIDMGGTGTVGFDNNNVFAYCNNLKQIYLNTASVTFGSTNIFTNTGSAITGGTKVIVSNQTVADAFAAKNFTNLTVLNETDYKFKATSQAYLDACVAGVDANINTTQADYENAVKEELQAEINWTTPFAKVASTPVVEVKLANGNGGYDVFHTSKGRNGSITGIMAVTVGDTTYNVTINKTIAPEKKEIKCDSIDVIQIGEDSVAEPYTGTAELLVAEPGDGVVEFPIDFATGNTTIKAVVVKGTTASIKGPASSSEPGGAFRNCTSIEGFFADSFRADTQFETRSFTGASSLRYLDIGKVVKKSSNSDFAIYITAFYNTQLESAYFDLEDYNYYISGWGAFGSTSTNYIQIVFDGNGTLNSSFDGDMFTNKVHNIVFTNKAAFDKMSAHTYNSANYIDASNIDAVKSSVNDYVDDVKTALRNENTFTNSTLVNDVIKTAQKVVASDITITVNMSDMIYDAAVDGAVIAQKIFEESLDPTKYEPIAITNTHNGSIKAVVTLTRGEETVSFNVEAPILAKLHFERDYAFDTDPNYAESNELSKFAYDAETDTITGFDEERSLIYIDGNDLAFGGDGVKIADGAFRDITAEDGLATAVIIKNAQLGKNVFRSNKTIRVAYLGEGVSFVENENNDANGTNTFRGASALEYVSYDDSIESVGYMEFYIAQKLKGFVMPKNVKLIGTYAFGDDIALTGCYISEDIKIDISASGNIVRGCNRLVSFRIPEGTKHLYNSVITNTAELKTLIFPTTLETISGADNENFKTNSNNLVLVNYANLDNVNFAKLITNFAKTSQGINFNKIITISDCGAYEYAVANDVEYDIIGDANADDKFDIRDLVGLKKNIANGIALEEIIFDINNDGTKGNALDLTSQIKHLLNNYSYNAELQALALDAEAKKQAVLDSKTTIDLTNKTVYYVDDTADANGDGSEAKPWKTLEQVNNADLSEGSVVLFKRGGLWRGTLVAQNGVTYSAYGEGAKPAIYANTYDGTWTDADGDGVWVYSETTADIGGIHLGGDEFAVKVTPYVNGGKMYLNYTPATEEQDAVYTDEFTIASLKENQFYSANNSVDGSGTLYFKSAVDPNTLDIELIVNEKVVTATGYDITIDNLTIKYGVFGVYITEYWKDGTIIGGEHVASDNINVTNCEIGWIGGNVQSYNATTGVPVRYGNGVEVYENANNIKVENNYIYECYDAAMTHQGGTYYENISYLNNIVENCTYGVEYFLNKEGDTDSYLQKNILIEGNIIRNIGFGHCSTRPDKYSAAIRCSSNVNIPSENFVINNNVFDRSNEYILLIQTKDKDHLPTMTNNTYVQYVDGLYHLSGLGKRDAYGEGTATDILGAFNMAKDSDMEAFMEDAGCKKLYLIFK